MEPMDGIPEVAAYFKDADYTEIKDIDADTSLRAFIAGMLSYHPWWLRLLYRIREALVYLLGLVKHDKPEHLPELRPDDISFMPGDTVSFFIVREAREDRYWVSETPQDKHLAAWLGVVARKLDSGRTRFCVFTTVRYLSWSGPLYFNIIKPFHHLVLWKMMKAGSTHNALRGKHAIKTS